MASMNLQMSSSLATRRGAGRPTPSQQQPLQQQQPQQWPEPVFQFQAQPLPLRWSPNNTHVSSPSPPPAPTRASVPHQQQQFHAFPADPSAYVIDNPPVPGQVFRSSNNSNCSGPARTFTQAAPGPPPASVPAVTAPVPTARTSPQPGPASIKAYSPAGDSCASDLRDDNDDDQDDEDGEGEDEEEGASDADFCHPGRADTSTAEHGRVLRSRGYSLSTGDGDQEWKPEHVSVGGLSRIKESKGTKRKAPASESSEDKAGGKKRGRLPTEKRKMQNRHNQRAFRERREKHHKDMESNYDHLTQLTKAQALEILGLKQLFKDVEAKAAAAQAVPRSHSRNTRECAPIGQTHAPPPSVSNLGHPGSKHAYAQRPPMKLQAVIASSSEDSPNSLSPPNSAPGLEFSGASTGSSSSSFETQTSRLPTTVRHQPPPQRGVHPVYPIPNTGLDARYQKHGSLHRHEEASWQPNDATLGSTQLVKQESLSGGNDMISYFPDQFGSYDFSFGTQPYSRDDMMSIVSRPITPHYLAGLAN